MNHYGTAPGDRIPFHLKLVYGPGALAAGGFLLNATGFDVALAGNQSGQAIFLLRLFDCLVPFVASGIAIWTIAKFPITEERPHEVRLELEARRGTA